MIELLSLTAKPKQLRGIFLHDQRFGFVAETGNFKILYPAIRCDQREIGAEEHFVFELGVGILYQLWRKILGRPTGKIDIDIGLVQTDRQRFILPGPGRVGNDERAIREINRHIVQVDWVGIGQPQATATCIPVPMPE